MTKNLALDYATRNLIAQSVRDAVSTELQHLRTPEPAPTAPQLHGPASYACEAFVIGSVLAGVVHIEAIPLQRDDFWAQITGRLWTAMQAAYDPRLIPVVVDNAFALGLVSGDPEHYELILTEWAAIADAQTALRDVASAVTLLLQHSQARRLATLLARLADGLCHGDESHATAYEALREHFATERSSDRPSRP